jgi:hypothetical protein
MFAWAGIMKVLQSAAFFSDLLAYDAPFPEGFLRLVAVTLPWLEAICGVALVFNVWPKTVRPVVSFLCLVFVGMLAEAVVRGLDVNCGCFGPTNAGWFERPGVALGRAVVLLVASLYLVAAPLPQSGEPLEEE